MTQRTDQLRMLTAFAVIKTKPADQTILTYIQSLKDVFQPQSPHHENGWRNRAHELETECSALKAKVEELEAQCFVQQNTASLTTSVSTEGPSQKKKNKKGVEAGEVIAAAHTRNTTRPSSLLDALTRLAAHPTGLPVSLGITKRVFIGLLSSLDEALADGKTSSMERVRSDMQTAVMTLLKLDCESHKKMLDQLSETLLVPLVSRFHIISMGLVEKADSPTSLTLLDGRPSLLAIFEATVSAVTTSISDDMMTSRLFLRTLTLCTVQQLYDTVEIKTAASTAERRMRVERLAIKDTIWYLSSTVHFLVGMGRCSEDAGRCGREPNPFQDLVQRGVVADLAKLVLEQERNRAARHATLPGVLFFHKLDDLEYLTILELLRLLQRY